MYEKLVDDSVTIKSSFSDCIDLELAVPMALSFGTVDSRPSGWVGMTCETSDSSAIGYGEGVTLDEPIFTNDSGKNIKYNMALVLQSLPKVRVPITEIIDRIGAYRFPDNQDYPTARFAVEMAFLDSVTKANLLSVRDLIGVDIGISEVPYGKSIGGTQLANILKQVDEALELNAKKIKLKISPNSFNTIVESINHVRSNRSDVEIMVDANGGFDPNNNDHLRMLSTLNELDLLMVEEPVSRVGQTRGIDSVRLFRKLLPSFTTPVCLDDCLKSFNDCRNVLSDNLADVINIKPGRMGSFLKSVELIDYAANNGGEVMIGGMFEATPGRCMTTILGGYCLTKGFRTPGDLSLAQERLRTDLVDASSQLRLGRNGGISMPVGAGWGF
jgi:O-succinylbenzoate synthase